MSNNGNNKFFKYSVVPYLYEGIDTNKLERSFKRYGWAYKYANKLISDGIYCEIVGYRWNTDCTDIERKQICGC